MSFLLYSIMKPLKHSRDLERSQLRRSIMAIRNERGGAFLNEIFMKYSGKKRIKHQLSARKTPQ